MDDRPMVDWRPVYEAAGMARLERDRGREALARAHDLIADRPTEPWDLATLAATAGYSPTHFLRRYAQVYGRTPARDLTHHRLLAARELLEATDRTVTEVCMDVGFASLGSFSDRFRAQFGRPPSAWRRHVWHLGELAPRAVTIPSCFLHRHGVSTAATS